MSLHKMPVQLNSETKKVTAIDKRLMGKLALKYQMDLTYIFGVLKRNRWDAEKAEQEIRTGDACREIIHRMAVEYKRETDEVLKLLNSVDWSVVEARKFAQQHRAWRLPDLTKARDRETKDESSPKDDDEKKKFACTFCPISFNRMRFFEAHLESHDGPKPFECDRCSCKFALEDHLVAHVQGHIDKRYACDLCSGRYTRREHLIRHLNIHARHSKKQMRQQITRRIKEIMKNKDAALTYKDSIKKAINIANKNSDLKCRDCNQSFTMKIWFMRHMKNRHGIEE